MLARKNCHRAGVLILFMCALVIAGCGKNGDTPKSEGEPKPASSGPTGPTTPKETIPKEPTPEPLAKAKPDVILTAKAFVDAVQKDTHFLFTQYSGKVVEVTGIVDDYKTDNHPDIATLSLRCGKTKLSNHAGFLVREKNLAKKVLPSQTVTVRVRGPKEGAAFAQWDGVLWEIIEAKGNIPTFTVEEFARELATTDANELRKKYAEQPVIVTGVVANVTNENGGTVLVIGDDKNQVPCWFPGGTFARIPFSQSQKDRLKPGLMVKVFGEYSGGLGGLGQCILLEPAP